MFKERCLLFSSAIFTVFSVAIGTGRPLVSFLTKLQNGKTAFSKQLKHVMKFPSLANANMSQVTLQKHRH